MNIKSNDVIISPSILAADFMNLGKQIEDVANAGAEWLHFDVMDGVFVPNISVGLPVLESINANADIILDVHLMILNPLKYVEKFRKAGADIITFHVEACNNACEIADTIKAIRSTGAKAGISIKPGTGAEEILSYIEDLDMVLVMTVEPGFGGQKFMADMMPKVSMIRKHIDLYKPGVYLQVDGGITNKNIELAARAGADSFVAGTSVFGACDIKEAVGELKNIASHK